MSAARDIGPSTGAEPGGGARHDTGRAAAGPLVRGWCPGALRPMESGDGLVVRIRPHAGRLDAGQAAAVARLAARHGNGLIDLSARGNLQLRGVDATRHPALVAGLAAAGLIDGDAGAEARRNIAVTPFGDRGEIEAICAALEAMLAEMPALPGKFGYAVDCGEARMLAATSADIRIERSAGGALMVRADGAPGGRAVAPDELVQHVRRLAAWFVASGGVEAGRGRMAAHLARGARLPAALAGDLAPAPAVAPPLPGLRAEGALVALPFGQMQAAMLAALARLGALRLTPWRMLLVEGASAMPVLPGLITRADDPLLRVVACTGAPGCPQALGETRGLARALAPGVPAGRILHVSGCGKGCARPGPADITLVAGAGGFALVRGGTAAAAPERTGLSARALRAMDLFQAGPDAP